MFDDVVEREEASEKQAGRLAAAVPDVLDSECAVEGACVNVAEVLGRAPEFGVDGVFAGNTGCNDAPHETARGRHAAPVVSPVLGAEEDTAMEAYEGEPGRVATAPAEGSESAFATGEMCRLEGWLAHGVSVPRATNPMAAPASKPAWKRNDAYRRGIPRITANFAVASQRGTVPIRAVWTGTGMAGHVEPRGRRATSTRPLRPAPER